MSLTRTSVEETTAGSLKLLAPSAAFAAAAFCAYVTPMVTVLSVTPGPLRSDGAASPAEAPEPDRREPEPLPCATPPCTTAPPAPASTDPGAREEAAPVVPVPEAPP